MYENSKTQQDWDHLRLILSIDRFGGVAGAARALGVTHATVSRRLAKAEADAGTLYFDRLPKGLTPNRAGRAAIHLAQTIEPQVHRFERMLQGTSGDISGTLKITIPPLMLTDALARSIATFTDAHPDLRLEFLGDNALLNLHRREADVAIRVTKKPPETLWGRKLADQEAGYYGASDWVAGQNFDQGKDISDLPLISFSAWQNPVPKTLEKLCAHVRIVATSDDMPTAIQLVRAGVGIARIPKVIGETSLGLSRITALPIESYSPIWLLTHPDLRKTPAVMAFMTATKLHREDYVYTGEVHTVEV